MSRPDDGDLTTVIAAQIMMEVLGMVAPDLYVRRDCAFCHRERSPRDDNHAPTCSYWVFFPEGR